MSFFALLYDLSSLSFTRSCKAFTIHFSSALAFFDSVILHYIIPRTFYNSSYTQNLLYIYAQITFSTPFRKPGLSPSLLELEMLTSTGIADGADVPYLSILAMNVRTEIAYGLARDGCTAVFWKTDTSSFLAQNWDWQEEQKKNLINLSISQEGKPSISMITEAGIIGKIGLNSRGVGVCLNAIRAQGVDFQRLPCHLALRTCLESTSTEEAVAALKKVGVASSCHILVADSKSAIGLECSHIDIVELAMERGVLTHTNHYIKPHHGVVDLMALKDSQTRFQRIEQLVREQTNRLHETGTLGLEDIRSLLKDGENCPTAICRSKTDDSSIETLFNIVMDLKNRRAEVVTGKPSSVAEVLFLVPRE